MLGGPLFYIGLCFVGWVMLWTRPLYGFLLTYALGMLAVIILLGSLFGAIPGTLDAFRDIPNVEVLPSIIAFVFGVAIPSLVFSLVGIPIVALRKRMEARR